MKERSRRRSADLWICVALLILIAAAFAQVRAFEFVNYDDFQYVVNNPHVRAGLTVPSISWALTSSYEGNWAPLTWLSYMLGCQIYGVESGWHHLTNVFLLAITVVILFRVLHEMTGAMWRSAFVALVLALHPMHVEAVAWIAERKEVLAGVFWMLTLWTYVRYCRRPGVARYLLVAAAFLCGILSKPMVVPLPFALLLVDVWPLGRWPEISAARLLLEKLPLFGMAAAASVITLLTQASAGAVAAANSVPLGLRLENAVLSYAVYIGKFFLPTRISVIYPYPQQLSLWQVAGAGLVLASLSAIAIFQIRRRPYLFTGWFWFVGALLPVIQIVQVGMEPRANRYTYVPYIGLSMMLAWGATEFLSGRTWGRAALPALGAIAALCLFIATFYNLAYWRNSEALFEHAIEVTSDNWVAHLRFSQILLDEGRPGDAIPHLRETLRLRPNLPEAHVNLGAALSKLGEFAAAEKEYRTALSLHPGDADAQEGIGIVATEQGRFNEALPYLAGAARLRPNDADAHYNLGRAYGLAGRTAEAIAEFARTVALQPDNAQAHFNLGTALAAQDRLAEASEHFSIAVRLDPTDINARFNLGSALGSMGRLDEAITQFEAVLRLNPGFEPARGALDYTRSLKEKRIH